MERTTSFAADYLAGLQSLIGRLDPTAIGRVIGHVQRARDEGRCIYAIGNGGSASSASHFVNDMGKGASVGREKRFRIIPLTDNVEWMTALSNDISYDDVFVEQLKNFAQPGDLLIAISGSGNSENVIRAVDYAKQVGCRTVGFSGFGGGRLKNAADDCIVVDDDHMGRVEDAHLVLLHVVCYYFMEQKDLD